MRTRSSLVPVAIVLCSSLSALGPQAQRGGQPFQLPDGSGKDLVQAACARCHGLNLLANSWGYTREGWEQLFSSMVALPQDQAGTVAAYLATHFPVKPAAPAPVLIPGSTTVSIREWLAPSLGSRPHDPLAASDGSIWWTGQWAKALGRAVNSRGVPWYVDVRGNRVGSIDPVTMEIREHTLPDPAARPRRIALTSDDAVWYTDYARGYLGRFDPATGRVREWPSPGGRQSQPYGIASVGDIVWSSESAVRPNTLVRFDPQIEAFQTWTIPSGGGVVRNMMATREGNLVLACSGVNRVALVEVGRM